MKELVDEICSADSSDDLRLFRKVLTVVNRYFFQKPDNSTTTHTLGDDRDHFSPFHVFWEMNYEKLLGLEIDAQKVKDVAFSISKLVKQYGTEILKTDLNPGNLSVEEIARVRFLTATQESGLTVGDRQWTAYRVDPDAFNLENVVEDPSRMIEALGLEKESQADKRRNYAINSAKAVMDLNTTVKGLPEHFENDASELVQFLIDTPALGFGQKITYMLTRDLIELGAWNLNNLEQIGIAPDINVMKISLRTGLLKSAMPILSSFLDIFCYQYEHLQDVTIKTWTEVWKELRDNYPDYPALFPGELDFFIFSLGRELCKENVVWFECSSCGHRYPRPNARSKKCTKCGEKATEIRRAMQCAEDQSTLLDYDNRFRANDVPIRICPFIEVCKPYSEDFTPFDPPKSISILQRTGWTTAYADSKRGGGGLRS
ncbi:MAG: hypothetical protein ACXADD_17755 [Candidatus Thorarchaeota archaeon]